MALELARVERLYRFYDVTATLGNGAAATVSGVDVALVPPRTSPDALTVWTASTWDAVEEAWRVLIAGPDAAGAGALVVPDTGADLWIRVTDSPEIDVALSERISII